MLKIKINQVPVCCTGWAEKTVGRDEIGISGFCQRHRPVYVDMAFRLNDTLLRMTGGREGILFKFWVEVEPEGRRADVGALAGFESAMGEDV